uniref:LIM zinc-binding domain-containing protein n=1 Tax=Chenopodium quinoa TaxID=63459 RepID=A0A803LQM0_CHEQI
MYRFEVMWLRDENCAEIIANAWEAGGDIVSKIACTSNRLSKWSKEKFGDFAKEMADCRAHMKCLMSEYQSDDIIAQMRALDDRMDESESREEAYWRQRSRQDWLKNEYRDEEVITEVLVSYFEELFATSSLTDMEAVIEKVESKVTESQHCSLAAPFIAGESKSSSKLSSMFSGTQDKCATCKKIAYPLEKIVVEGENYHKSCFRCAKGGCFLSASNYAALDGYLYCKPHFAQLFKEKGSYNYLKNSISMKKNNFAPPSLEENKQHTTSELEVAQGKEKESSQEE